MTFLIVFIICTLIFPLTIHVYKHGPHNIIVNAMTELITLSRTSMPDQIRRVEEAKLAQIADIFLEDETAPETRTYIVCDDRKRFRDFIKVTEGTPFPKRRPFKKSFYIPTRSDDVDI